MEKPAIFRKRLIPEECILLKDDVMLYRDEKLLITSWNTLKPKKDLDHGVSCYFLDQGYKISKFYDHKGALISWYCDIIDYTYDPASDTYVVTDLLADVILYPDGFVKVVDLDELAEAFEKGLLSGELLKKALRQTNQLLTLVYNGGFSSLQSVVNHIEKGLGTP